MTLSDQLETRAGALEQPTALSRRGLLIGAGAAAAAIVASTGGVLATPDVAGATAVSGLVTGAGNGVSNRLALQAAVDAAPPYATLQFPAGTYEVDVTDAPIWLPRSISLTGALGSTPTVFDLVPSDHHTHSFLRVVDGTDPNGVYVDWVLEGRFSFSDFTIHGPATCYATPWDTVTQGAEGSPMTFGIAWGVRTSNGTFNVERVTITGALPVGVMRSGMGLTRVIDCDISAYISPVEIYDDTNTPFASGAVIHGGTHTTGTVAGSTTKTSSIGLYIHPCCSLAMSDVTYRHFQRFGVYTNGEPDTPPEAWVMENVTIDGCGGIVQTATKVDAVIVGLTVLNGSGGQGGVLKGSATFIDCSFSGLLLFGVSGNHADSLVHFISCWIAPVDYFIAQGNGFGEGSDGTLRFTGCTVVMGPNSFLTIGTSQWKGTVELLDCEIFDCGADKFTHIYLAGGSLFIDNTAVHSDLANPIVTEPSVPVTGAATIGPAVTCPTPPA